MSEKEINAIIEAIDRASKRPSETKYVSGGEEIINKDCKFQHLVGGLSNILNIDLIKYC